jgi:NTP pyrophosphatase (non-canonical NTP hydrolase)
MKFNDYQKKAAKTIQDYPTSQEMNEVIPFLGIVGEAGSVLSELKKKIRDGRFYNGFDDRLAEELGDVLWYVSAIATKYNLALEDVASQNLSKILDRFSPEALEIKNYDKGYPAKERFPSEFQVVFEPFEEDGQKKMRIYSFEDGENVGDPLSDNTYVEDGYRYHDVFHYGYVAYLGWSPVIRKLFERKRKSEPAIDENEDGARPQIIEEMISLYIFERAKSHNLLKYSDSVDTEILKAVQMFGRSIEIKDCSARQWEEAILNSYRVYNELVDNDGGRIMVSLKNRKLIYIGKH